MPPLATGFGDDVFTTERSAPPGAGLTLVVTDAVLLPVAGSGVEAVTKAVLVSELPPGAVTVTWIVTRAKPGVGMEPRFAMTLPLDPTAGPRQLPWLTVQERKVVPTGRGSFNTTPLEVLGPLLLTPSWYVNVLPDTTGLGEAFLVSARS